MEDGFTDASEIKRVPLENNSLLGGFKGLDGLGILGLDWGGNSLGNLFSNKIIGNGEENFSLKEFLWDVSELEIIRD